MKTTPTFHTAAMLSASWNVPMLVAPSPKNVSATCLAPELGGVRGAERDRQTGADDRERAEQSRFDVGEVHRAADALAAAGRAAHQLGEARLHRNPARQRVAVPAIGDRQVVVGPHRRDRADRDGLLPLAEMGRALDQALHEELLHLLLEQPDLDHLPVPPNAIGGLPTHVATSSRRQQFLQATRPRPRRSARAIHLAL